MTEHRTGTRQEWLAGRRELLDAAWWHRHDEYETAQEDAAR